jgi:hypothetical protein
VTRGDARPYSDDAFFRQSLSLLEDVVTDLDRDAKFRGAWARAEAAANAAIDALQAPAVAADDETSSRERLWAAIDELVTRTREIAPTYGHEYPGANLAVVLAARVLSHVYLARGFPAGALTAVHVQLRAAAAYGGQAKQGGLIDSTQDGREVIYRLAEPAS